jgi:hypothetical protein
MRFALVGAVDPVDPPELSMTSRRRVAPDVVEVIAFPEPSRVLLSRDDGKETLAVTSKLLFAPETVEVIAFPEPSLTSERTPLAMSALIKAISA